jgi:hypothetical protein
MTSLEPVLPNGIMTAWGFSTQKRSGIPVKEVLIVVVGGGGGESNSRDEQESAPTLRITQQPEVLRSNGVDRRIQGATLV